MPSKILNDLNLSNDRPFQIPKILLFSPGMTTLPGFSVLFNPHGANIDPEKWDNIRNEKSDYFDFIGEVVEYYLNVDSETCRNQNLMNSFFQSIFWFHEACREQNPVVAIVKYSASLEALVGGKGKNKIYCLVESLLKNKRTKKISTAGLTAKEIVNRIYTLRSQAVHGTLNKIWADSASTKWHAEYLARNCILKFIHRVCKDSKIECFEDLLP